MAYRHIPGNGLLDIPKLHAPGHNAIEEMVAHINFVMVARRTNLSVRMGKMGVNYNHSQYIMLRLLNRHNRLDDQGKQILARLTAHAKGV